MTRFLHVLRAQLAHATPRKWMRMFLHVSPSLKILLLRLPFLIAGVRVALSVFSFRRVLRFVERGSQERSSETSLSTEEITWAVSAVGQRLLPQKPCLTLALVTLLLLRKRGTPADLHIGVKTNNGLLQAHAWVESQDQVVIGQLPDLSSFSSMPPLKASSNKQKDINASSIGE